MLSAPGMGRGSCSHTQVLSAYIAVPLLLPTKGSRAKESFTGIKAGDRKARLQEELIGDQESKEVELVLLGDMEVLFLAEGPYEDRSLSPSISAGWQHLSPSTVLLTVPFAEKVGEGRAGCRRCCLMPGTAAQWGAGTRLWEANLSILEWREARTSNQRQGACTGLIYAASL